MSVRKVGTALIAVCASLLLVPVAASAQTTPAGTPAKTIKSVAMSGTSQSGKKFVGHFNVNQFVTRGG
jgi:hypothetical protein